MIQSKLKPGIVAVVVVACGTNPYHLPNCKTEPGVATRASFCARVRLCEAIRGCYASELASGFFFRADKMSIS